MAIGEVSEAKHPYRVVCRAVFAGAGVLVLAGVATGCSASGSDTTASGHTTARPGAAAAAQPGATATASPVTSSAASSRRAILAPATVPPVSDECTEQLTTGADGNVSPLLCSGGGVNTLAWKHYATGWTKTGFNPGGYSDTLGLGPSATAYDVDSAMCYDFRNTYGTRPITVVGEELAQAYYGWTFTAADNPVEDFETGGCSASGTGTNVGAVLVPATVHPVIKECSEQISNTQDGNITPLFCANDRLNAQAWEWYANFFAGDSPDHPHSELLTLGRGASQAQAYQAMCQDEASVRWTGQETQHAGELAYAYYGWTFSQNSLDRQFENGCPAG